MRDKTTLAWMLLITLLVNVFFCTPAAWASSPPQFSTPVTYNVGYYPYNVESADMNGDGNLDIVSMTRVNASYAQRMNNPGEISASILTGSGNGGFSSVQSPTTWSGPTADPGLLYNTLPVFGKRFVAKDITGDSNVDLAVKRLTYGGQAQAYVEIYSGNGDLSFGAHDLSGANDQYNGISIISGDFDPSNGNGLDLAYIEADNVRITRGHAPGALNITTPSMAGIAPGDLAAADFNGDGKLDIATANSGSNTVSVLIGNGDCTFQPAAAYGVGPQPESIVAGDFNGDGNQDIAVANKGAFTVSLLLGNGSGAFGAASSIPVGGNPQSLVAADFNRDGILDLVVANYTDNNVTVLTGIGNGTFAEGGAYAVGQGPCSLTTGDYNKDGALDLAVANFTDNSISVLINMGVSIANSTLPSGTVNTAYNSGPLSAAGGTAPYVWGANGLPAGLAIASDTGAISGTPTTTGSFSVQLTATDSGTPPVSINKNINLAVNLSGPVINTGSLASGTVGSSYNASCNASGGTVPYTWSATGLPVGLTIAPNTGAISGTPTASGTFTVHLTVTDQTASTSSADLSLVVSAAQSSSGGGGGSSGTTVPPANVVPAINLEASKGAARATVEARLNAQGIAIASLSDQNVRDGVEKALAAAAVNGAGDTAVLEILVKPTAGEAGVEAVLSDVALKFILNSKLYTLRIITQMGSITLDRASLHALEQGASSEVRFSMRPVVSNTLPLSIQSQLAGRQPINFEITSGGQFFSDLRGGRAQIGIPCILQNGERPENLFANYISPEGEIERILASRFDSTSGSLRFATPHLSTYAIGYEDFTFNDVSGWYAGSVQYLSARGVLNGTSENTFAPDSKITRAQFVQMLAKLSGAKLSAKDSAFSDVHPDDWFSSAVGWASENQIVAGMEGKFAPDAPITRQDMAVLLIRYAEKADKNPLTKASKALTFADKDEIAGYALDAVAALQQAEIMAGKDGNRFVPVDNATRAEAAKVVALYLQSLVE